jgi:hypothetical protein
VTVDTATTTIATIALWGSIGVVAATALIALRVRYGSIAAAFRAHQVATNLSIAGTLLAGFWLVQAIFGVAASISAATVVSLVAAVMWLRSRRHVP